MRTISLNQISSEVERLCIEINHVLHTEVVECFKDAATSEGSPLGRDILKQLVNNAEIAEREMVPYCQDTGVCVVFIEMGEEVRFDGSGLMDAINKGVAAGYLNGYLRNSMVSDPLRRVNTGDNTPAVVHIDMVPGDSFKMKVCAKGSGSENMSRYKMLVPAEGVEGVKAFVLETIELAGPNPCPPVMVGVGIGGTMELCCKIAKRAMYRGFGTRHSDPFYAELEDEMLREINNLGIGPQSLGGTTTAFNVNIETYPCHIGSLPVAVNLGGHAHRYGEVEL